LDGHGVFKLSTLLFLCALIVTKVSNLSLKVGNLTDLLEMT
jgi:hypothetical protein